MQNKRKKFMKMNLKKKLMLAFLSLISIFSLLIFLVVNNQISNIENTNMLQNVKTASQMGMSYINEAYIGDYDINNKKLYKGEYPMESNNNLMDTVYKQTAVGATLYNMDTPVATSIKNEQGKRVLDVKPEANIKKTVLADGKEYLGETTINGHTYIAKYIPLKDKNKNIIGMWFVGIDKAVIAKKIANTDLVILIATLMIILLSIFVINLFVNRILKNVNLLIKNLKIISSGDLTQNCVIDTDDEINDISENINTMRHNMKHLISDILALSLTLKSTSENIAATSEELTASGNEVAAAVNKISFGAENQFKEIESCVTLTNSLSQKISSMEVMAKNTVENSKQVKHKNFMGIEAFENLKNNIEENTKYSKNIYLNMEEVAEKSKSIGDIIYTISSIANQTNLLSLNASIEAAIAGEAGKGFAVVANEVRQLAVSSQLATQEIDKVVKEMQASITKAMNEISAGQTIVDNSNTSMELTKDSFKEITIAVDSILSDISELKFSLDDISNLKTTFVSTMKDISIISELSTATTKEVYSATEEQASSIEAISESIQSQNDKVNILSEYTSNFKIS